MTAAETRTKNVKAATTSIVVTALLLVIVKFFLFFSSIQPEGCCGPGNTNVGMEVNLGNSESGSGDIQPMEPVGSEQPQQDEPEAAQSLVQEDQSETQQQEPAPSQPEESKPVVDESVVTSKDESPVEAKDIEKKKDEKPVVKKDVIEKKKEPETKPVDKKVETPKEKVEVKEEKKQPQADVNAVYKPGAKSKTDGTASGKEGVAGSEGDDKSGQGDKGVPGGTPGAAVYKGTPGGGNGSGTALDLYGWEWDRIPKPNITNSETGQVVFEIVVNQDGEVIRRKKLSGSLSPAAERACINAIDNLSFTKKPGATVPTESVGKITFVVRAE